MRHYLGKWTVSAIGLESYLESALKTVAVGFMRPTGFLQKQVVEVTGVENSEAPRVGTVGRLFFEEGEAVLAEPIDISYWNTEERLLVLLVPDAEDPDVHWQVVYQVGTASRAQIHGDGVYKREWDGETGPEDVIYAWKHGGRLPSEDSGGNIG